MRATSHQPAQHDHPGPGSTSKVRGKTNRGGKGASDLCKACKQCVSLSKAARAKKGLVPCAKPGIVYKN
jgi:hypothetical protein